MDTRWARIWKPDESKRSGRRAKARLIIEVFQAFDTVDPIKTEQPLFVRMPPD